MTKKSEQAPKSGKSVPFANVLLDLSDVASRVRELNPKEIIFSQGDAANTVLYIKKGGVRLSVINQAGKEAVLALLGPNDFLGEGCLTGQKVRMATAVATLPSTVLVIGKEKMARMLQDREGFSGLFIRFMLNRNIRIEEDLVDQLFNSSEKRLARALLLLARYGHPDEPRKMIPKVSQEILAEMVGTTRPRVNFFMNKFRKLGFIEYNGGIKINRALLTVVLHD